MTRQEILSTAKPILFNEEMVRAILDDRKTETRRLLKPHPGKDATGMWHWRGCQWMDGGIGLPASGIADHAPYQPGDLLWVRETWHKDANRYMYKAHYAENEKFYRGGKEVKIKWRPSIHMPKEAARIFLRATGVRAERLQEITEEQAQAEGIRGFNLGMGECGYAANADGITYFDSPIGAFARLWNDCYATLRPVKVNGVISHYESYPWAAIRLPRTYKGLPWEVYDNPWVWAVTFERVMPDD